MSDFSMSRSPFRYHHNPHKFSTYSLELGNCDFCSQKTPGYKGPFYGTNNVNFVCEECLIVGKLAERNAFTNEGDFGSLKKEIQQKQPQLNESEIVRLAKIANDELCHRTPHVVTWQDFLWPVHCADYCGVIKEAGKPDLLKIAPMDEVRLMFGSIDDENFKDWFETGIRPDSPNDNLIAYSIGVYLFQCLHCQKYIVLWDTD